MVRSQKKKDCEASTIDCKYKNASTYVKLQDAYAAESNALGTWAKIGYSMPGSTQFNYAEDASTLTVTCATGSVNSDKTGCVVTDGDKTSAGIVSTSTYAEAWSASNKAQLNECAAGKNWKISAQINQAGTSVSAGSVVYDATVTGDGCTALTPTFTNIGKTN